MIEFKTLLTALSIIGILLTFYLYRKMTEFKKYYTDDKFKERLVQKVLEQKKDATEKDIDKIISDLNNIYK